MRRQKPNETNSVEVFVNLADNTNAETSVAYLRDLRERCRHVPGVYNVGGEDIDALTWVIEHLSKEEEPLQGVFIAKVPTDSEVAALVKKS